MKPTVIDPKTTSRAEAYDLWMSATNPMVTFFKTLDVTPLYRLSRRRGLKFNMLLCWCIGKAACDVKEFYLLPVGRELLQYDSIAENVLWILQQEQSRGSNRIIISGHNNHIIMQCQNAGTPELGSLLAEKLGDGYFAIGTDFYKSICNLPKRYTGKRIAHTFYSCDPLAKASKKCDLDVSFLDFSKVPEDSALTEYIDKNISMGSLGESYSVLMNFVPRSYRVQRTPQEAYDAMIFVADATPIEIKSLKK